MLWEALIKAGEKLKKNWVHSPNPRAYLNSLENSAYTQGLIIGKKKIKKNMEEEEDEEEEECPLPVTCIWCDTPSPCVHTNILPLSSYINNMTHSSVFVLTKQVGVLFMRV